MFMALSVMAYGVVAYTVVARVSMAARGRFWMFMAEQMLQPFSTPVIVSLRGMDAARKHCYVPVRQAPDTFFNTSVVPILMFP